MLSKGHPMEQAPHSMQLPKLTSVFFCSWFHSYTPAGQKCVQYFPSHLVPQTCWSMISMCGLPVSSLYLTVKSLSVSFSIAASSLSGAEPFPDPAHQPDGVDVVGGADVLVGGVDPVVGAADANRQHGGDPQVGNDGVHRPGGLHERPQDRLSVQITDAVDHALGHVRIGL